MILQQNSVLHVFPTEDPFDWVELNQKISQLPKGSIVTFEPGIYSVTQSLCLKNKTDLALQAKPGARLIGGILLHGLPLSAEEKRQLPFTKAAANRILCAQLTAEQKNQLGGLSSRGYSRPVTPSHAELFCGEHPMHLAQYPKPGHFLKISSVPNPRPDEWDTPVGNLCDGFFYEDERPAHWNTAQDIWVHGYWAWDWANSYEKVDMLDVQRGLVKTREPFGNMAFREGQRFCFLNIAEELINAGDYWIDYEKGNIYWIPDPDAKTNEMFLSLLKKPLIQLEQCEDIKLNNLRIEVTCGDAVSILGSKKITVTGGTICNTGNRAVVLQNCKNCTVCSMEIFNTGDCGVLATGGDRITLERADVLVSSCHFHHIARWTRTYQPPILFAGVGMTAEGNLIHDCPHMAIVFWGNEMTIENNEIYRVVLETGDAGAVYSGRDYTFRGNRVCKNYIHHLGGVNVGSMGIYNDDCVSGTVMENNIFCEVTRAIFLGGGRDFVVRNNLFIQCRPSVALEGRACSRHPMWNNMVNSTMRQRFEQITEINEGNLPVHTKRFVSASQEPYYSRYPQLQTIESFYSSSADCAKIPPTLLMEHNAFYSEQKLEFLWFAERGETILRNNDIAQKKDFVNYELGDYTIRAGSEGTTYGYQPVEMTEIGLGYSSAPNNPPYVLSGMIVEKTKLICKFQNISKIPCKSMVTIKICENTQLCRKKNFEVVVSGGSSFSKELIFEIPKTCIIDLYAESPGIRPARLRLPIQENII